MPPSGQDEKQSAGLPVETLQLITVFVSAAWTLPRIYVAVQTGAFSLIAESILLVTTLAFGLLVYFSMRAAGEAKALLFPEGDGRIEAVANLFLAMATFFASLAIISVAIFRFFDPRITGDIWVPVIFLCVALAIDIGLYFYARGRDIGANVYGALWQEFLLTGIIGKTVALVGFVLGAQGDAMVAADSLSALLIAAIVLRLAQRILTDSVWQTSDRALEETIQLRILRGVAEVFHDFDRLENVRTKRYHGRPTIEITLGYDDSRSWSHVNDTNKRIKTFIENEIKGANVIVVPVETEHPGGPSSDTARPASKE